MSANPLNRGRQSGHVQHCDCCGLPILASELKGPCTLVLLSNQKYGFLLHSQESLNTHKPTVHELKTWMCPVK